MRKFSLILVPIIFFSISQDTISKKILNLLNFFQFSKENDDPWFGKKFSKNLDPRFSNNFSKHIRNQVGLNNA